MRVALLSAGPSLAQTFDPDAGHDLRIGVNRAVGSFHCDWWSCGDAQTFAEHEPIGYPALFTLDDTDGQFERFANTRDRLTKHRVVLWSEIGNALAGRGLPASWTNWSITAGLVLAVWKGAKHVDVYGHDMSGVVDIAGRRLDKRAEQWKRVGKDWLMVSSWAREQGLTLKHHLELAICT